MYNAAGGYISSKDYYLGITSRGRPNLNCQGYRYVRSVKPRTLSTQCPSNTYWRCSQYWSQKCTAGVIMKPDGYLIHRKAHNHEPFTRLA